MGYLGEVQYDVARGCSGEFRHPDSGCKNVTTAPLRKDQIEAVAQAILAERIKKNSADQPRWDKWAAANSYFGRCNMGMIEIGDNLAHVQRSADGAVAVIELVDGRWVARPPKTGERIYV